MKTSLNIDIDLYKANQKFTAEETSVARYHGTMRHARYRFYRATHFSAERGHAIACRLSVCPSVTLVICDHIGWKSWKLTAQSISPTPSLIAAKRRSSYSHGNMGKFWGD